MLNIMIEFSKFLFYAGFRTPGSPVRSSPMERSMEASASPSSGLRYIPPLSIDRKQSEPVLGRAAAANISMEGHHLSR